MIIIHARVWAVIGFMASFTFLIRLAQPIGTVFFNMQLSYFAGYVILFVLGVKAYRWNLLTNLSSQNWGKYKPGVNAEFSINEEKLAWPVRKELGGIDIPIIYASPKKEVIVALEESATRDELGLNWISVQNKAAHP